MKLWSLSGLLLLVPLLIVAAGVILFLWPAEAWANRYSELGSALIGGSVVAFAVLIMEQRFANEAEDRNARADEEADARNLALTEQLTKAAENRNLRLTLGLGETFIGIDLRNRDLSDFYLATKNFSGAKFDGADLRGTNLSGANLSFATLTGADLRGVKLSATQLTPSEYLTPGSISFSGKPLADAITQGITIRGAKYDSSTEWPEGFEPSKGGAVFVD